jgi:hypothetical protein
MKPSAQGALPPDASESFMGSGPNATKVFKRHVETIVFDRAQVNTNLELKPGLKCPPYRIEGPKAFDLKTGTALWE